MIGCQIEFEIAGRRGMRSVFYHFPFPAGMHICFESDETETTRRHVNDTGNLKGLPTTRSNVD